MSKATLFMSYSFMFLAFGWFVDTLFLAGAADSLNTGLLCVVLATLFLMMHRLKI